MKIEVNEANIKMIITNARLWVCKVFEAESYEGGPKRYTAVVLFDDAEQIKQIRAAVQQAAKSAWGKEAETILEEIAHNTNKNCFVKSKMEDFEGYMKLSAHRKETKGTPHVCGRGGYNDVITPESGRIYSGCYVNVSLEMYCQTGKHAGLRSSLLGLQVVADGPAFSGGTQKASEDDFEDLGDDGQNLDFDLDD